jgi:hypothetical protein
MTEIPSEIFDIVNHPGRIGALATADSEGKPDVAYFGSPRLMDDGTLIMGSGDNLSLKNMRENPYAAFFCVDEAPVTPQTPGCRLYLKVREIFTEGELLVSIRESIAKHFSEDAAKLVIAAVTFDVTHIRPLMAAGYD